jgi:hypothetical protein
MEINKLYKRIGANAFNVSINEYREFSENSTRILTAMDDFKNGCMGRGVPVGNLISEKFTGANVDDIRIFAERKAEELGIKWHAIIIDYMTELENMHGISHADSYMYHKTNANDLFNVAGDTYTAVITAHQAKGEFIDADDMTFMSLGESKGIIHKPDNIIGLIQSPDMKLRNTYMFKLLKGRDSEYKNYKQLYDIDYNYMRISQNGGMIKPEVTIIYGDLTNSGDGDEIMKSISES